MELKNNALFKETCFIGGKWIESDSKEKIRVDYITTRKGGDGAFREFVDLILEEK